MSKSNIVAVFTFLMLAPSALADELSLAVPDLRTAKFGFTDGWHFIIGLSWIVLCTLAISLWMTWRVYQLPAHRVMLEQSQVIYDSCKKYLVTQAKFLAILFGITTVILIPYLWTAKNAGYSFGATTAIVVFFALVGMAGSYAVAWYGIRINTWANSRTAFASMAPETWLIVSIPLQAGMSIGLFLISLELIIMVGILLFIPREIVSSVFLGFAVGESLGAASLRLAGGIFTKIADIGADLMKVIFKVKEDDPRNPGVIADCVGDNAGDSIGPTADFFESYGVTGVALITFFVLDVEDTTLQAKFIVWLFSMRFLMDVFSGVSFFINQAISERKYRGVLKFDFEEPLIRLLRISAVCCISVSFGMSYVLLSDLGGYGWAYMASFVSLGTLAALLIPETTKFFSSPQSQHVQEIVLSGREGGPSLTVLSGFAAGKFSAFWQGGVVIGTILLASSLLAYISGLDKVIPHIVLASWGFVAYGMLSMGPGNIATDSYGPVTDNAQSIYELSQIDLIPNIEEEIQAEFGFWPNRELAKERLEENDACGNTFKATVKPVLIATAVAGAITMIFSTNLLLEKFRMLDLALTSPAVLGGLIFGGAVAFWFAGAAIQAVVAGAYQATEFVRKNMDLTRERAGSEASQEVVRICTLYAQKGAWNILLALICFTLGFALVDPNFFIAYLIGLSLFGMFLAIYMANAGGAWDNAKKIVEVILKEANTALHEAMVVGDTVGDPFKDTAATAYNPIIKFSALFGLIVIETAVSFAVVDDNGVAHYTVLHAVAATVFIATALVFVWRSFYRMRIQVSVS